MTHTNLTGDIRKNMATKTIQRKNDFLEAMRNAGMGAEVTRQDLLDLCASTGIYNVIPSWITHDKTRRPLGRDRDIFSMPELGSVVQSPDVAPALTCGPDEIEESVSPQGAVEQPMLTSASMIMGMTGGERDTLIPEKISTYVPWGNFKDVAQIVKAKIFYPCFITGLSGNGKTTMVEQVCAKAKRDCYRVNITKQTDEDDLLGGFRLINGNTVWQDGPVVSAMKNGGVLLLDEVDLASHNVMCLQPVLEGKGVFLKKIGEWVTPAAGFTVFATANTKGKGSDDGRFIGTSVMNEAFLDRFPVTLEQEYAPQNTEEKILRKAMESVDIDDSDFAKHLTKWAGIIRKSFYEGGVDEIISTRRLVDIVKALAIFGGDKPKALAMCLARFDDDTKQGFMDLYDKVDGDVDLHGATDTDATDEDSNSCPF